MEKLFDETFEYANINQSLEGSPPQNVILVIRKLNLVPLTRSKRETGHGKARQVPYTETSPSFCRQHVWYSRKHFQYDALRLELE